MGIRIPGKPHIGVSEIRHKDSDSVYPIAKVVEIKPTHQSFLIWEQTTFVDKFGKAFYDKFGIPFQGKK